MIFEKERYTTCHFIYGNVILYIVTGLKYFGMYLLRNGNWCRTEQKLAQHTYIQHCTTFTLYLTNLI